MLVGYYHDPFGQPFFVLVVNASNHEKIVHWVHAHLPQERAERPGHEIVFSDVSQLWAMFAIQGPRSVELLQPLVDVDLASMKYYRGAQVRILHPAAQREGGIISRTGYTGEDGFELSLGSGIAAGVWEAIIELGQPLGLVPAGLGARDTLRLEAGMPLYGHELSEKINPFQAGLGFACHLAGYDFPGRDALLRHPETAAAGGPHRIGDAGRAPVAAGRLPDPGRGKTDRRGHQRHAIRRRSASRSRWATSRPAFAQPGVELEIDIRGRAEPAQVVEIPFYQSSPRQKG